jgi:hypothetical protein
MMRTARLVTALVLSVTALFVLDACGRREKLTPPHGADYPRQYPRE